MQKIIKIFPISFTFRNRSTFWLKSCFYDYKFLNILFSKIIPNFCQPCQVWVKKPSSYFGRRIRTMLLMILTQKASTNELLTTWLHEFPIPRFRENKYWTSKLEYQKMRSKTHFSLITLALETVEAWLIKLVRLEFG